ncbi:MAG: ABC transporter substrate-binding protein [Candidatus Lambdaproteobacteria bacterium]|nr:ABC transporter substrate-binding protein [Candidatus Lambdaproteobacteria bacterium]
MNRLLSTLATGLLAIAVALTGLAAPAAAQGTVKIGFVAPLSGPWARQGYLKKLGAEMAIEEINASGGIKALGGAKMELVVVDAGDSTEKAKNAAQRLLSMDPTLVGAMGAWLSSFTLAITEVTERADLPWLTLSYSDAITDRGYRYVFQTSPTAATQSRTTIPAVVALSEAATGSRPKTAGILQDNTASPVSYTKPIREGGLKEMGLDLVYDEIYTPPLSDATPLIQRLRAARPGFLILASTAVTDNKLIIEKLNEFRLGRGALPIVANGAHMGVPEMLKLLGPEQLEGLMFIVANWGVKGQEDLIERFKKRTGEPWLSQDSATDYGQTWILKEALERAGKADRVAVAEEIRKMDLTSGAAASAFAGGVKFLPNGRRDRAVVLIVQWQNGAPVTVYPPEVAVAKPIWPKFR